MPLTNAGAAGRRKHRRIELAEDVQKTVAFERLEDADRTGDNHDRGFHLNALVDHFLGNRGCARNVFIGRICARTDQRNFELLREAFFLGLGSNRRNRHRGIRRERTVDMGFERRQVDFHHAVIVFRRIGGHFRVSLQILGDAAGKVDHGLTARGDEIALHGGIKREDRRGGARFRAHVADRSLAGCREGFRAFAEEFDDGVGTALRRKNARELQNHILRRGPALQAAGELHADELRHLELPLHAHEAVDQVSAAHADRQHAETARSRRVAVGNEHHAAREVVVLEENLVANARARRPEVKAVALGSAGEEIVRFVVRLIGNLQVRNRPRIGHHQVVTDNRRGQRNTVLAR